MSALRRRIYFSWRYIAGRAYLVAYNLDLQQTIPSVERYAAWLSDRDLLSAVTVRNEVTHLRSYFEYSQISDHWDEFDDARIAAYREFELGRVVAAANSRANERTSKRTVNQKLRRLYAFLFWCQRQSYVAPGTIGPFQCDVTAADAFGLTYRAKPEQAKSSRMSIPLLFRRVGEGAHLKRRHVATDVEIAGIREYFRITCTEFTYVRNLLTMDVAAETGWRRGSIASLLCTQFQTSDVPIRDTAFNVRPAVQKFGYDFAFPVSETLRTRILSFVATTRLDFLEEMRWHDRAPEHLFISARDGKPLTAQALSVIFGRAFKAIGAPPGAGLHSLRRRFVKQKIEEELLLRLKLGLDTSAASITASVAISLGHTNPESLASYVNQAQTTILQYAVAPSTDKSPDR